MENTPTGRDRRTVVAAGTAASSVDNDHENFDFNCRYSTGIAINAVQTRVRTALARVPTKDLIFNVCFNALSPRIYTKSMPPQMTRRGHRRSFPTKKGPSALRFRYFQSYGWKFLNTSSAIVGAMTMRSRSGAKFVGLSKLKVFVPAWR
jgi:hypothetical protein